MEYHIIEGEVSLPSHMNNPKGHLKVKSAFVRAATLDMGVKPKIILGGNSAQQTVKLGGVTLTVVDDRILFNAYSTSGHFDGYGDVRRFTELMESRNSHMGRLMQRAKINGGFDEYQHYEETGFSEHKRHFDVRKPAPQAQA